MTRQIAILSGKGGAGKTSITASIIKMMDSVVAVDADVNASNLPILLPHAQQSITVYFGMNIAQVNHHQCTGCGACLLVCPDFCFEVYRYAEPVDHTRQAEVRR